MPQIRKGKRLFSKNSALSPIFATLILVFIVTVCGAVAYLTVGTLTTASTESYSESAQNDQAAISERIGFQNMAYDDVSNNMTVCIINCGKADDLQVQYVFLYNLTNNQQELIGYYADPMMIGVDEEVTGNSLNILQEAYFDFSLNALSPPLELGLGSDTVYLLRLITQRGSSFDYTFAV